MSHIFFICSAIVDIAAMNIGVQVHISYFTSLDHVGFARLRQL